MSDLLRGEEVIEIVALARQGLSRKKISELTGLDRKTVRKYLDNPETPVYGPRQPRRGKLDPYRELIDERLEAGVWNAVVLLRELRESGYPGGYTILKDYVAEKRRSSTEACVRRFETPPGHQAQVDWGHLGYIDESGERSKIWSFVLTLGNSRGMFADIATDQKLETLLLMHEEAFRQLGGVPREILYDWMKTVVLGTDDRGEIRWHPVFADFARYWGFTPRLCRPYRAQTKGKVESGVKYVKRNFIPGRQADSFSDLRNQLRRWTWEVANRRVHGTTHLVVMDALLEERRHLQPLSGRMPYPYIPEVTRRVGRDGYVAYGSNRYPVPWAAANQDVTVYEIGEELLVRRGGEKIAVHQLCRDRHRVIPDQAGYHRGMPFGSEDRPSSDLLHITSGAPQVEVRPLSAYEAVCQGGTL